MTFQSHITTAISAPCSGWIMLLMFVLLLLIEWMQPRYLIDSFKSAVSSKTRLFGDSISISGIFCVFVYEVLSIAFVLCLMLSTSAVTIRNLAWSLLFALGYELTRIIGFGIVNYTFDLQKKYAPNMYAFASLNLSFCLLLFPITLVMINIGTVRGLCVGCMLVLGMYWILFLVKMLRSFWQNAMSFVYIMVYLFTLEILPLGAAITGISCIS